MLRVLLIAAAIWLLGDLSYSLFVRWRIRQWETTFTRNAAGVRAGAEAFAAGPEEAEEAVLLIHGLNDSPACYRELVPVLAERGYYCRAMRLPGFGEPMAEYGAATREQWLAAIDKEVRELAAEGRTIHLIGHSLGGALTIAYLCEHPQAAAKAVLLAPALGVSDARSPLLPPRKWHAVGSRLLLFTRVTANPFGLDAARFDDPDYPQSPYTPRHVFDEFFATIDSVRDRPRQFRTPVLLALSRNDKVIDWKAADAFVRKSAAPVKEFAYFDDSGHALTIDHTAARVAARILRFLQGDPRAEAAERP